MKARALPCRCGIAYALIQIASRIAPRKSHKVLNYGARLRNGRRANVRRFRHGDDGLKDLGFRRHVLMFFWG